MQKKAVREEWRNEKGRRKCYEMEISLYTEIKGTRNGIQKVNIYFSYYLKP